MDTCDAGGAAETAPTFGTEGPRELVWVSKVLAPVVESAATAAADRRITFSSMMHEDAPIVLAVTDDLAEVVARVLDNAVKYTPPDGAVAVSVAAKAAVDGDVGGGRAGCRFRPAGVDVWVADTGRAMAAADLPRVLKRGFRGRGGRAALLAADGVAGTGANDGAAAVAAAVGALPLPPPSPDGGDVFGSGLGLAIVAELVAAAGGCVRVESLPAGGTGVCVWMPRAKMRRHLGTGAED